ncbi:hypothetical protein [Candidatus Palauibacter sp.]|uniref:hypothetical protein n=1 Tax=Candidatus Palauibacter sp. TaxID=3101350 RepID=UPI003B59E63A
MPRSFKLEPGAMIRLCALTVLFLAIGALKEPALLAQGGDSGCTAECMEWKASYCDDGDMCTYVRCYEHTNSPPSCHYVCAPSQMCVF